MKLKHIIILQNKIDLIRDTQAKDQYQEILKFVQGEGVREEMRDERGGGRGRVKVLWPLLQAQWRRGLQSFPSLHS